MEMKYSHEIVLKPPYDRLITYFDIMLFI